MGIVVAFMQAICWAGTSIILRTLSTRLNSFVISGLRTTISWLILVPVALLTVDASQLSLLTPLRVAYLAGSVILGGAVGDFFYVRSLKMLGVGRAFPITSSNPVFIVLFGILFMGDAVEIGTLLGMVLVLFGVYLVARPRRYPAVTDDTPPLAPRQLLIGVATAFGAALAWAGGTIILTFGLTDGISPIMANAVRLPAVIIVSLTAAAQQGQFGAIRRLRGRTLGLVVLVGILGWAVGGTLYTTAVQMIGPGKTALIGSTAPIFAVPLSYFILKERPTRNTLIGTAITVAGIMLVI